jgi:hypothetical protein
MDVAASDRDMKRADDEGLTWYKISIKPNVRKTPTPGLVGSLMAAFLFIKRHILTSFIHGQKMGWSVREPLSS